MVAYSFQKRFIEPIRTGAKRHTIRNERTGRARHARPGEPVQLYFGLRTRHCSLIAAPLCEAVWPIRIDLEADGFGGQAIRIGGPLDAVQGIPDGSDPDAFAVSDGFQDWSDMAAFWRKHHPGVIVFEGVLIRWVEIQPSEFAPLSRRRGAQIDMFEAEVRP